MLKGLTVGFIITGYLAGGHAFSAEQPPNLVVIFADDLGYRGTRYAKPYHSMRKSCIRHWSENFPAHVVSEWTGHADLETTNKYYLQVAESEYRKAAENAFLKRNGTENCTENGKTEENSGQKEKPDLSQALENNKDTNECGRPESNWRIQLGKLVFYH